MDDDDDRDNGMNRVALDPAYERQVTARRDEFRGLTAHAGAYVVVCAGLLIANLLASPGYLWVLWPVFGWGIGVASHAAGVFGAPFGGCHTHGSAPSSSLSMGPWRGGGHMTGSDGRRSNDRADNRPSARRRTSTRRTYSE